ncbi:SFT2-domain-containing protein [Cystobasidium minutum MCA 4210]|uniref:SFT2-domain-containing protein n=1 Tax=Cystobasidium minutum MCA 4210 TaxID=1397322 RepID=UPI0034CDB507|eukprot:jgi/Rhomi1/168416/fgenesh1_kg.2_\
MDNARAFFNLEGKGTQVRTLVGAGEEQSGILPELSRKNRMIAFGGCLIAGLAVSLVGSILFVFGQVASFAVLYVIGICISLVGTGFLVGFGTQFKKMMDPVRIAATAVFLGSIVMVFVSAFALGIDALVIVFAVITYLAYLWYILSYVPFARDFVKSIANKFTG